MSIELDAVSQTVGIDFIDDPASFDCLYNFQEKTVRYPTASKPTAGQVLSITGKPNIPVIVKMVNPNSVATYGEFEFKIVDKSIDTKEAARRRAQAEIDAWAEEIDEGSFKTKETGLDVGQTIDVTSTIRSITETYIISRIQSKMRSPDEFEHMITLVSSETFGIIEFFQQMLIQRDKEIEIDPDETIDNVYLFQETLGVTDSIGTPTTTSPPSRMPASMSSRVHSSAGRVRRRALSFSRSRSRDRKSTRLNSSHSSVSRMPSSA